MSVITLTSPTPKPGPYPKGRRCAHTDEGGAQCITLLNRYHNGDHCHAHERPPKVRDRVAFDDLRDLICDFPSLYYEDKEAA